MTAAKTSKSEESRETRSESREGKWEREVRNPVDDYPERPLSEARGDNVVYDPSVEEERKANVFLEHKVAEPGNADSGTFNVTNGVKHIGDLPHADYVEDKKLHPGYVAPVYED